ncbi:MAG: hypothetical protein HY749_15880 [Gammaproteobacteria bacterium]|nr:hypothetical protein [Gammaproteobacteria bacterium]
MGELVDKQALCAMLKWSRPRLDRTIERDHGFPVQTRGAGRGAAWQFDPDAVLRYLGAEPIPERTATAKRRKSATIAPGAPAHVPVGHRGEATARQKRDLLQAAILADKLKLQRGDLLVAEEIQQALHEEIGTLSRFLTSLPDTVIRALNLPPELAVPMGNLIDEERRRFVGSVRRRLLGATPESLPDLEVDEATR